MGFAPKLKLLLTWVVAAEEEISRGLKQETAEKKLSLRGFSTIEDTAGFADLSAIKFVDYHGYFEKAEIQMRI